MKILSLDDWSQEIADTLAPFIDPAATDRERDEATEILGHIIIEMQEWLPPQDQRKVLAERGITPLMAENYRQIYLVAIRKLLKSVP